ncbi:Fructosamine kinase-domain-containing protein [Stachybotrys elegans]|uniref:protein-ribulosamine 3-kinase n=1 Tax=Stachybotrys elegans TaxID=80388 RepID=A0A8K0SJL8_9HYPO|nr:Fructosamine kinase-domain-containing protein [Stachybotrys elegans]
MAATSIQPSKSLVMLPQHNTDALNIPHLDVNVLTALPDFDSVAGVSYCGMSAWAKTYKITIVNTGGGQAEFFMKVSTGYHGREALKGEYISTMTIHTAVPSFCPKPLAWGTFDSDPEAHFYVCKFYYFYQGLPDPESFCEKLARLHGTESPNGKFGFECTTYNGSLPQDNTWHDSWERFFVNGLHHVLRLREERGGPEPELDAVLPPLFEKVIPRLLGPLEREGRKVKPVLVHGDLWCGNASIIDENSREGIIYDGASFFAHNEYELGNWRSELNMFTKEYFEAYQRQIPISEPREDFDDRNALYALRFNLHAATLFPNQHSYVETAIGEIKRLGKKFAND